LNPEKYIVYTWLNNKGFFTITNIRVAENKGIDILALKVVNRIVKKVVHYEVSCSVSSQPDVKEIKKKFDDPVVVKKINILVNNFVGRQVKYEKVVVMNSPDKDRIDDIKVERFEDIITDFMKNLAKHNYKNDVMRTTQLIKFLLMAKPSRLAEIVKDSGKNKVMNLNSRERFINELTKQKEVSRIIGKKDNIDAIFSILSKSPITAEKLAEKIDTVVLTKRTRKRFIETLLKQDTVKEEFHIEKKQKFLDQFFK